MTPREELVALRRLAELEAKAAGAASSQPAPAPVPATTTERALGSVPGRFALGAAETAGDAAPSASVASDVVSSLRDLVMGIPKLAALPVDMGVNLYNAVEQIVTPGVAPLRTLSEAADQSLNEMGVPQTRNPIIRAVNEAVGSGGVSIGAKGVQLGQEAFAASAPLLSAAERRAGRALRRYSGTDEQRRTLADRLRNYRSPVNGVKPTAAEVVGDMPEGAPLQQLQASVARSADARAGGPAIEFARREVANEAARETAAKELGESHGAAREAILEKANNFSDRLRKLTHIASDSSRRAGQNMQLSGQMDAFAAESARRAVNKDAPTGPIARALGLAKDAVSFPSHGAGATPRPPARYTQHAANAESAAGAADEAMFAADARKLQAAGANLEKELLENTGLVALGPREIVGAVGEKMTDPRNYANEIASKTYAEFAKEIARITKPDGSIDARAIDEVRKSFGPKLSTIFEKQGWDTKDAAFVRAMRSSQSFIDDAIEAAGGSGYKAELERYSNRIKDIKADRVRAEEMYTPKHKASVPLATMIDEQTGYGVDRIPGFISWKMSAAKALSRAVRSQASPEVIGEMSKLLQDPFELSLALNNLRGGSRRAAIASALGQYGRRSGGAAVAATSMVNGDREEK